MNLRSLLVRRGDAVIPAVNKLSVFQRSLQILPGRGILLGRATSGVRINARALVTGFTGAWAVSLSGSSITVNRGFIDGIEPVIDDRPISGITSKGEPDPKGQPSLKLKLDEFTAAGKSFIAIRLKTDATGKIIAPEGKSPEMTIVQTKNLNSPEDDTVHLHPIAMLRRPPKDKSVFGTLIQIAYFDYQHRSAKQNGKLRHFLDPA